MRFIQWQQIVGPKQPPKTMTRRLVKGTEKCLDGFTVADLWVHEHIGEITGHRILTPYYIKWQVGRTYAVQRPDGKTVGRTDPLRTIRRERLGEISEEDCWAEGIPLGQTFDEVQGIPFDSYDCPICHRQYHEGYLETYACLWNHCGGNWERDKDANVWVLDWSKR